MENRKKIFVLEFITSVGGVQTVYENILPLLGNRFDITFCDPYNNPFDEKISSISNIHICKYNSNINPQLNWSKTHFFKKIFILLLNFRSYFKIFLFLKKEIVKRRIDLLYVAGKKELLFAFLLSKRLGVKFIYHAHGFNSTRDISIFFKKWIMKSEHVIAVSKSVQTILIQRNIPKEKISIVYNGIVLHNDIFDYKAFSFPLKICFIGTIQPKKGLHILVPAVFDLLSHGYLVSLDIFGSGSNMYYSYECNVKEMAGAYLNNGINFLGFVNNASSFISKYDLLVLPSTEISESFGMVLIEAMSKKIPVIGSNIGGIPEVISNDECGLLVEPSNVKSLKDAILYFYINPDQLAKYGLNGYNRVKKLFTVENQSKEIMNVIEKEINK